MPLRRKNQVNNTLELSLLSKGYDYVIGIDEVGRGCWAGPVVVGAFVFEKNTKFVPGVNDSKLVTSNKRIEIDQKLQHNQFAIASASVEEIDEVNIVNATRLAIERAVKQLKLDNYICLLDGYFKEPFHFKNKVIPKADGLHYSVAAASIIAKVYRDTLMRNLAKKYPGYGFESHVGYGTKKHRMALDQYGVCEIHRKSYAPIRKLLIS